MNSINELKRKLVEAAIICEMEGLCDAFGHISVRIPESDHILMTPQGPPGETKLSDIVTLDLKGNKIGGRGKPNTELPIHTSVYRVRRDVQSIVHVHPPKVIAFSIAGEEILPMRSGDRKFSPSVRVFGDPGAKVFIDSQELGDNMVKALGKSSALIIRGHGSVTVGESIEAACLTALALEKTAEIQFMASMLILSRSVEKNFVTPMLTVHPAQRDGVDTFARLRKREWDFYLGRLKAYVKK